MRLVAVLPDAAFGAFVAARAEIHVEHEDALPFIESLFDELGDDRARLTITAQRGERLLNEATTEHGKASQHLEKVSAAESCELEVIQGGARGAAHADRDDINCVLACSIERGRDVAINLLEAL